LFELFFKYSRATFERGELVFGSGWPLWLLVALVALGVVVAGVSLYRYNQGLGIAKSAVIGVMQSLMIATVLVMLWRPALVSQTLRPQENSVAILLDASASMSYGDGETSRLEQAIQTFEEEALPELDELFLVDRYVFSEDAVPVDSFEALPSAGAVTHLGDSLLTILRGSNAGSLAAVILVSDGVDNSNQLDAARIADIAGFGVPVHTVGVGRESLEEDIELEDVAFPPQGPAGSTVSALVSIRHARGANTQIKVYDGDAILASEPVTLPNRPGVTTRWIDLDVGEAGVKDLRFSVDAIQGEQNFVNNTQLRPMEVPEERRTILYVEGEPRWEYKFIRRAIDEDGPLRVASLLRTTPNKFYRQGVESPDELVDGFPSDEETLFAYDALIIGSYEAASLSEAQQAMIRDFVGRRGGTLLMLGGRRGLADGGWAATAVADVLPVELPELDGPSFIRFPAKVYPTEEGERSLITRFDADEEENLARWQFMPDLADFQYVGDEKPGAVTLLEAEIQGDRHPLLVYQRYGRGNAYVLATGGTWRWQMQMPHEDQHHETFWRQLLQAIATSAAQRVTLSANRAFYADDTDVVLRAEVRDRSFEATSEAEVEVTVTHGSGASETIPMTAVPGEPGVYTATYAAEIGGVYRFEAEATMDEDSLGTSRIAVRREDGVAEHFRVQQDRALLTRIAEATGGRYFQLGDVGDLPEAVSFSEAGIVERQLLDLWNMPIFFLALLLLKAGEWILRLVWGRL
jgi:uncharacterized membrane protein